MILPAKHDGNTEKIELAKTETPLLYSLLKDVTYFYPLKQTDPFF